MRHQRYVIVSFVCAAVLLGMAAQGLVVSGLSTFDVPDTRVGGLVDLSSLVGLVLGIASFAALLRNREAVQFTDEVVGELRKVTWPTRDETLRATTTVIVTTLFVSALLYAYDTVWAFVARQFLFDAS